ncbi:MAG: hypothetical protein ACXACU_19325, partial [Candidatus Hodarchaeales archaeon]
MVSNLTKIGLIVIVCSFLFGVIAQSLNLPFLTGSYIDIPLIEGISHPFSFQIIVEWYFHSPSGSEFSVSSSIIISKAGQVIGTIPGTINDNNWVSSDDYLQRHYITVPSKYGSSSFSLFSRLQSQPVSQEAVNDLYLEDIRVKMTYIIFYMIISPLLFLAGIA